RTVPSWPAEASVLLSGLNATPHTSWVWPSRIPSLWNLLSTSHKNTLGKPPAATILSFGLNATEKKKDVPCSLANNFGAVASETAVMFQMRTLLDSIAASLVSSELNATPPTLRQTRQHGEHRMARQAP